MFKRFQWGFRLWAVLSALPMLAQAQASFNYRVTNDWGSGYTAEITIQNNGSSAIQGWTLGFNLGGTVVNLWNGQWTASGSQLTVRDAGWNATINAGQQAMIGFQVSYSGTRPNPTNCTFNGVACSFGGGSTPTPPTISLTAPTNNATVSGTTTVSASVSGSGALGVTFYVDNVALGSEDTTSPYSVSWNTTGVSNGTHTLKAVVRTASTTVTSANVSVNVQNTTTLPPTITLTAPANNTTVSGTTAITASVSGVGALGVTFYVGNVAIGGEDTAAPYEASWNTTTLANGNHTLTAVVRTASTTVASSPIVVTVQNAVTPPVGGFLSVSGNQIIDSQGNTVRFTGINWFGFETSNAAPHGLWSRDYRSMLKQIKSLGFNSLRLPWGNHILRAGASASGITFSGSDPYDGMSPMNAPLQGKTPLQILDLIIEEAGRQGLKVILDNHSRKADNFISETVWYLSDFTEQQWINDWVSLANRYRTNTTVVAFDLDNEPHGNATWGNSNPATDWNKAAERAGTAILAAHPDILIVVEGVENYNGSYWWGGNLEGAKTYPINLNPAKLVYSPHDYGPEVYQQTWFNASNFPANMAAIWDQRWGYLFKENHAPILLGEFGIKDQASYGGKSLQWMQTLLAYMGSTQSWTYWTWNPNSGDTGGILQDNWTTIHTWKMNLLQPHLAPMIGTTANQSVQRMQGLTLRTEETPKQFGITEVYPNPFQNEARVSFSVPQTQAVQLALFNALGQEVAAVFAGTAEGETTYTVPIQAQNLPNGLYLLRFKSAKDGLDQTKRLIVLR